MINPFLIVSLFSDFSIPPSIIYPPEVLNSIDNKTWQCPSCNTN